MPGSAFARRQVGVHGGDEGQEELVRVVLLVLRQVLRRLHPPAVQKVARHQRVGAPGVRPRHDLVQLARQAVLILGRGEPAGVDGLGDRDVALRRAQLPDMSVLEEEPSHRRGPHHRVQHGGQEARVAQVSHAAQAPRHPVRIDARQRRRTVPDDVDLGYIPRRWLLTLLRRRRRGNPRVRRAHTHRNRARPQHEAIELGRVRVPRARRAVQLGALDVGEHGVRVDRKGARRRPHVRRRFLARANHRAAEAGQGRVHRGAHRMARVARRDAASRQGAQHARAAAFEERLEVRALRRGLGGSLFGPHLLRRDGRRAGRHPVHGMRGVAPTHDADA
mmetsp:Transcript_9705/g.39282  ORF Transcript_9705/g.39282 Transcript_9705/m.39282 type:complete len:334 (+) Transcript_9705:1753-2754(+)